MFKSSNHKESGLEERSSSSRRDVVSAPVVSSNPVGNANDLSTDSVDALMSCIKTWQNIPLGGRLGARSSVSELRSRSNVGGDLGYMRRNLSVQIPIPPPQAGSFKRFRYPSDSIPDMPTVFRNVGGPPPRGMRMPLLPPPLEVEHPPVMTAPSGQVDQQLASCEGLQNSAPISSAVRAIVEEKFVDAVSKLSNNDNPPASSPDIDELTSAPRLIYLATRDSIDEHRESENEENPLLSVGMDRCKKAVITPRDIMVYGRHGSVHNVDMVVPTKHNSKNSGMLKDVSINCQIDQIRSGAIRPRRMFKERNNRNSHVDEFSQLAARLEKIRGVCYCRSDNSWTAWWTEKGRNRKKAFKVSRFGFNEARARAIAHRLCVEKKMPELRMKRSHKEPLSDASFDPEADSSNFTPPPDSPRSSHLPNSSLAPLSLSTQPTPRMQTRGSSNTLFEILQAEVAASIYNAAYSRSIEHTASEESAGGVYMNTAAVEKPSGSTKVIGRSPFNETEDDVHTPATALKERTSTESLNTAPSITEGSSAEALDPLSMCTTADSPDCRFHGLNGTPDERASLYRDITDFLMLDDASARTVEAAISCAALGLGHTVLPTGEAVRVLPQAVTDPCGRKVTVVLIRHT